MNVSMVSTATLVAFFAMAWQGCGQPHEQPHKPAPRAVQVNTYDGSEKLGANKRVIVDAVKAKGGDLSRQALVVAIAMLETNDCCATQRDMSKDGDGTSASRNYSAFNYNRDCLGRAGYDLSKAEALNDPANLAAATDAMLLILDRLGEDGALNYHRGGSSAFADGVSYGAREYRATIRATQAMLVANPCMLTSNQRLAADVPHV